MAIGIPITIGTALTTTAGTTNVFQMTTSTAIVQGDLSVVSVYLNGNTLVTTTSVTDGTNSYTRIQNVTGVAAVDVSLWYKANAAAVSAGAVITATFNASTTGANNFIAIGAVRVQGLLASPLDVSAKSFVNTSTSLTIVGAALANNYELVIGSFLCNASTLVQPVNFTNQFSLTLGNSRNNLDYRITATTGPIQYTPTATTSVILVGAYGSFLAIDNPLFPVVWPG